MTQIILQPAANTDDLWSDGTLTDDNTIRLGRLSNDSRAFFRFPNVTILKGATIDSATLTVRGDGSRNDNIHTYIKAVAADNQAAPATHAALFALTLTTAVSDLWEFTLTTNGDFVSGDFKSVIQEITDRAGWVSGQAIALVLYPNATTNEYGGVYAYNASSANSAKLTINYTSGGGFMMFSC
jgi:type IV pilus assembly protein PilY1